MKSEFFRALRSPGFALQSWLDHTLRVNVFELRGDEIISGRGRRPENRVKAREILAWQIHYEMCFAIVVIELTGGMSMIWLDHYNDLIGILRTVVADRERP